MKRRKFLEFLGKAAVASGIAIVAGLPDEIYPGLDNPVVSNLSIDEYAKLIGIRLPQSLPSDVWGSGWSPEKTAKWVSFDNDGFTINWSDVLQAP